MNIEQILRDAIESKTARILKEEYGIEWNRRSTNSPKRQCVSMV